MGEFSRSHLLTVTWWVCVVFVVLVVLTAALLVVLRLSLDAIEERRQRRATAVRDLLFTHLMGEPDEAEEARRNLKSWRGRRWDFAEQQAFLLLPKLRGDIRAALVELLRERGALHHALAQLGSWSAVHRCRGAFGVGVLGGEEHVESLVPLLQDATFLVRRVTVRALGNLGSGAAVAPLLRTTGDEQRLSRDLVYALHRIGSEAAPDLRAELEAALAGDSEGRHPDIAARALGLVEDLGAVPLLLRVVPSALDAPTRLAAAEALGRIGSPEAIPVLAQALFDDTPSVRQEATRALGVMGSPLASEPLLDLVETNDPIVSREAADALRALGTHGLTLLRGSTSPYSVEAVALADLEGAR